MSKVQSCLPSPRSFDGLIILRARAEVQHTDSFSGGMEHVRHKRPPSKEARDKLTTVEFKKRLLRVQDHAGTLPSFLI